MLCPKPSHTIWHSLVTWLCNGLTFQQQYSLSKCKQLPPTLSVVPPFLHHTSENICVARSEQDWTTDVAKINSEKQKPKVTHHSDGFRKTPQTAPLKLKTRAAYGWIAIKAMLGKTTHFACSPVGCCTLLSISLYSLSSCRSPPLKKRLTQLLPY